MNDFLITLTMGVMAVTAGTLAIIFRHGLRRLMTDLLVSMYGRFGVLTGDRLSLMALVLVGSGFIAMGLIAISLGLVNVLFL